MSRSSRREKLQSGSGPRKLAPLDHIKILYDGAAANLKGENRKIFQKKDLVDAVREMNSNQGLSKLLSSQSDSALAFVRSKDKSKEKKEKSTSPRDEDETLGNNASSSSPTASGGGVDQGGGPGKDRKKKAEKKKTGKVGMMLTRSEKERVQFKDPAAILQESLNVNSKKFNELKVAVEEKEAQLNAMIDELASLQVENESLRKMELHQTAETHRIDELERQIADAIDYLEQKQFRRGTLQHMKKRLERNQVAFDAHIKGMEEALNASSREFEEVKLLMRQLESGNAAAQETLRNASDKIMKERDLRNKQLAVRRQEAANARRMEQWREQREKERLVLDAELRGDLSEEGEKELIEAVTKSAQQDEELEKLHQRTSQAVSTYEEAFAAIREATGVRTLDEMVEKFLGQSANKQALVEEKLEAEQRQRMIKEELARVQAEFSEFKAAGIGGSELNREMYDKLDNDILEARHELKIKQAVNARLEKILIQVRAGMLGLLSRLSPFRQVLGFEDDTPAGKTGNEVLDLTISCESKLVKLLDAVNLHQSREGPETTGAAITSTGNASSISSDSITIPTGAVTASSSSSSSGGNETSMVLRSKGTVLNLLDPVEHMTHVNNIRVKPRRAFGNGDLGTPLSSARSILDDDDMEESKEEQRDVTFTGDDVSQGSVSSAEDDEEEDDDSVFDAATLKKQAKARMHRAMEEQKAGVRRQKTLNNLKEKRSSKQRVKRLAQPSKHRQKKQASKALLERPDLQ